MDQSHIMGMLERASDTLHLREYPIFLATGMPEMIIDELRAFTSKKVVYHAQIVNDTDLNYLEAAVLDEAICKVRIWCKVATISIAFGARLLAWAPPTGQTCLSKRAYFDLGSSRKPIRTASWRVESSRMQPRFYHSVSVGFYGGLT